MINTNPYQAYAEDSILHASPLGLVVALYEGAIESSVTARKCLTDRDIPGRSKAINKIIGILTELLVALNDEKGGEVSKNLRRLYAYIQSRVIEAHQQQNAAPLEEVEKLLSTVLGGWKEAQSTFSTAPTQHAAPSLASRPAAQRYDDSDADVATPYGNYVWDTSPYSASSAYAF
jgi:flagellar protein FliS